ncbi:unnamed protein product [Albugo candida]|uniref:DNA-(apurinic or apyrimidinic site) endonuclease n=1 Tax=Albugo candida TaxID=65357 RepID=A0A024GKX3_9STRA|nr:unnamed protein product [Albugo candida]|eukprot:CCI46976.1 unnamed protein product [Albugo candida]
MRKVEIVSWNVNGLRAILQRDKVNLNEFLHSLHASIICLQETKLTRSELDEELACPKGKDLDQFSFNKDADVIPTDFDAFYSHCRVRNGYSGVVTFVRSDVSTIAAEEGLTGIWTPKDTVGHVNMEDSQNPSQMLLELESEGRTVITDHKAFILINVYCPAIRNEERLEYKIAFHELLTRRIEALREASKNVILVGDLNIARQRIDHCDPGASEFGEFEAHPCRKWLSQLVSSPATLVDIFRAFYPDRKKAFTCWNAATMARKNNFGTRIDYILVDERLQTSVLSCRLEPERLGSDHCPVSIELEISLQDTSYIPTPALASKYHREFAGKQQNIQTFLTTSSQNQAESFIQRQPSAKSISQKSIKSFFQSRQKPSRLECDSISWKKDEITRKIVTETRDEVPKKRKQDQTDWKKVLTGQTSPTPLCYCNQPSVARLVVKKNENWGRRFFVCTKPAVRAANEAIQTLAAIISNGRIALENCKK